jgi:hypothetical protein
MQRRRHDPGRTVRELARRVHLRQRDEAELGVAGAHELERLRDVFALYDPARQSELPQRLQGGLPVRRRLGIREAVLGKASQGGFGRAGSKGFFKLTKDLVGDVQIFACIRKRQPDSYPHSIPVFYERIVSKEHTQNRGERDSGTMQMQCVKRQRKHLFPEITIRKKVLWCTAAQMP